MYFYAEEGGTPTPDMGAHCRHLANTISHLNYLLFLPSILERCILEALLRRVLYCGHSTQYSYLVIISIRISYIDNRDHEVIARCTI